MFMSLSLVEFVGNPFFPPSARNPMFYDSLGSGRSQEVKRIKGRKEKANG